MLKAVVAKILGTDRRYGRVANNPVILNPVNEGLKDNMFSKS